MSLFSPGFKVEAEVVVDESSARVWLFETLLVRASAARAGDVLLEIEC